MSPRTPLNAVPVALSVAGGGSLGSGPLLFGRTTTGHPLAWISYERPFVNDPVVITTVMEMNDAGAATRRLVQGGRTGFGIRTWNCSAADVGDSVAWLAIEPGVHTIDGHTIQAGHHGATSAYGFSVTFPQPFATEPVVLLEVDERTDDNGATACRIESLSTTGVSGRCWNNGASDNADNVMWVALEPTSAAGLSYNGRRLWAGHVTPTGSDFTVALPQPLVGTPETVLLGVEYNATGGPSVGRLQPGTNGTTLAGKTWHCPAGAARTAHRMHWLAIE